MRVLLGRRTCFHGLPIVRFIGAFFVVGSVCCVCARRNQVVFAGLRGFASRYSTSSWRVGGRLTSWPCRRGVVACVFVCVFMAMLPFYNYWVVWGVFFILVTVFRREVLFAPAVTLRVTS